MNPSRCLVHMNVCTREGLRNVQSQKCIEANPPGQAGQIIVPLVYSKGDLPLMSQGKEICCYCFMVIKVKIC